MESGRSGAGERRMAMDRVSDRDLVVTRTLRAPAQRVFAAWTTSELFQHWWVPKSFGLTLVSCELDARVGGTYRLVFRHPDAPEPMAFQGTYQVVTPNSQLVWTNEEAGGKGQVTTVSLEDGAGQTRVSVLDRYPSKEALDDEIAAGSVGWNDETFDQLETLLAAAARTVPNGTGPLA